MRILQIPNEDSEFPLSPLQEDRINTLLKMTWDNDLCFCSLQMSWMKSGEGYEFIANLIMTFREGEVYCEYSEYNGGNLGEFKEDDDARHDWTWTIAELIAALEG